MNKTNRYVLNVFRVCLVSGLYILSGCAYQNPAGHWVSLDSPAIYFAGVELDDAAITSAYKKTCREAQQEIKKKLIVKLPAQIKPLDLLTVKNDKKSAELKLQITQCDIDVDQAGGNFSFYLSLPVRVVLTENNHTLLDYQMQTYEQIQIDVPDPIYEFDFSEAVERTLMLFNGKQVWIPDDI